jgi:hypothetical protein
MTMRVYKIDFGKIGNLWGIGFRAIRMGYWVGD